MAAKAVQEAFASVRAESRELTRTKNSRHPLDPVAITQCFVGPGILYAWIYKISSGSLRFYNWQAAAVLGPAAGFLVCCAATAWARGKLRAIKPARGPVALAACLWVAVVLGCVQGDENFHWYVSNMYNYQDSATYTDIAPSTDRGQSYMDAGQVYFQEGSYVAREEMAVFKSANLYCVAPIVGQPIRNQAEDAQPDFSWGSGAAPAPAPAPSAQEGPVAGHGPPKFRLPESGSIDFWAVGMDCCNQTSGEFWCGQVGNPRARAGMRMLRDDSRPFYALAVQVWAAKRCPEDVNTVSGVRAEAPLICLPAKHPLFFYWVVDPMLEVDTFAARSSTLFYSQLGVFLAVDLGLCLLLLWLLFVIGVR
jgi:hypothetical protein